MALDHVRDFFFRARRNGWGSFRGNESDGPGHYDTVAFLRWITHFCAPIFVFSCRHIRVFNGAEENKNQVSAFLLKEEFG